MGDNNFLAPALWCWVFILAVDFPRLTLLGNGTFYTSPWELEKGVMYYLGLNKGLDHEIKKMLENSFILIQGILTHGSWAIFSPP